MSFKTDRLVALFPDAAAAAERASLLHAVLDALGAELVRGDAAVKDLLKSHWINHARAGGLDGLGALLGVERRLLPDGTPEGDETFRPLLQSTVSSFKGGGTLAGIQGAVRAALGLPYDLKLFAAQLAGRGGGVNAASANLLDGLAGLVRIEEFAPKLEVMLGSALPTPAGTRLVLDLEVSTIEPMPPRIEWTFTSGARQLSLMLQDTPWGVRARPGFEVPPGAVLRLSGSTAETFSASIGSTDVSAQFSAADGGGAPWLPRVPAGSSRWIFAAGRGAAFDAARFDAGQVFDAAAFSVRMQWLRLQPLVFDVIVPYFIDAAVRRLLAGSGYEDRFKLFKGASLDAIQRVVDRSRAAGVRGAVQYQINLPGESSERKSWEDQGVQEIFSGWIDQRGSETHDAQENLTAGALSSETELHNSSERFAIGGVFNVAVFDGSFGFL